MSPALMNITHIKLFDSLSIDTILERMSLHDSSYVYTFFVIFIDNKFVGTVDFTPEYVLEKNLSVGTGYGSIKAFYNLGNDVESIKISDIQILTTKPGILSKQTQVKSARNV